VEKRGCRDYSAKCAQYSRDGLCGNRETSSLMSKTCPFSCGHCRKRELDLEACGKRELDLEARGTCKDTKSKCEVWAIHGMCKSDPDMEHFMAKTCPFACDMCWLASYIECRKNLWIDQRRPHHDGKPVRPPTRKWKPNFLTITLDMMEFVDCNLYFT